jgi:ribonucleoside-diphosphate reductase alpha chain
MQAWDLGCLGITIFRDGCKGEQVLNVGVKPAETAKTQEAAETPHATAQADPAVETVEASAPMVAPTAPVAAPTSHARDRRYRNGMKVRPGVVQGYTRQVRAPEGKVNVTLNSDEDGVLEVFVNVGKAGSDVAALAEALGRMISIHLQIDSPLSQSARAKEIAHQLRSIGGSGSIGFGMDRVRSLPDAVARALELHLAGITNGGTLPAPDLPAGAAAEEIANHAGGGASNGHASQSSGHAGGINPGTTALYTVTGNLCPECGCNTLVNEEGCKKCYTCGHSEC